jgi:hypothetical protein
MLATAGFLLLAGVVAGAVGSAGGITSLVSYPGAARRGRARAARERDEPGRGGPRAGPAPR